MDKRSNYESADFPLTSKQSILRIILAENRGLQGQTALSNGEVWLSLQNPITKNPINLIH